MDFFLNIIVPILVVVAFYFIMKFVNTKDSYKELFVKFRILLGCIGVGIFLREAYSKETFHAAVPLLLLSILLFYGAVYLQSKNLTLKK
jgi:hypothetical protein